MNSLKYRPEIQVYRGIAVLLVILYHLQIPGFENGFVGVDIFFVISGYLMSQLYQPGRKIDFFKKRIRRLLPSYFITIIATLITGFFVTIPSDYKQLIEQAKFSSFFLPNVYFWYQDSYFTLTAFNPLLNLWSLGLELQFYVMVPLITWIMLKNKSAILFLSIVSLLLCILMIDFSPKTSFFLIPFRLWEFLIGFYSVKQMDWLTKFLSNRKILVILVSTSLLLLFAFPLRSDSSSLIFGHPALFALLVSVTTKALLCKNIQLRSNLITKFLVVIGNYSYSIYLIHFPLLILLNYSPFQGTIIGAPRPKMFLMYLILLLIFTFLMYHLIEKPFRNQSLGLSPLLLMAVLTLVLTSMFPRLQSNNFKESEILISNAFNDRTVYRCGKMFRVTNPMSKTCPLDNLKSKRRIMLLGNSHADSIKETFTKAANELDISVYFWVRNNPLLPGGENIDDIILETKNRKIQHLFIHYSAGSVSPHVYSKLVESAVESRIQIVFLGPTPEWPDDVPFLMWNKELVNNNFSVTADTLESYNQFFRSLAEKNAGKKVFFYDLSSVICNPICAYADVNKRPYFWDSNHLTVTGSQLFFKTFLVAISQTINN